MIYKKYSFLHESDKTRKLKKRNIEILVLRMLVEREDLFSYLTTLI